MEEIEQIIEPKIEKRNIFLVLFMVFVLTIPTIPLLLYKYGINNPMQTNKEISIEIKSGSSINEISETLLDKGLISSPFLFKVYLKLNGLDQSMQAGVYTVPPRSTIIHLADILQNGRNDVKVTYVEGWRVEQLGLLLSQKLSDFDYEKFVTEAKPYEGKLFPDTYIFNKNISEKEVLEILKNNFQEKASGLLEPSVLQKAGLSENEALVFASIVEREVYKEDDREIVAGILIKRWEEGMRLEADATTQYAIALDKHCIPEECRSGGSYCDLDPKVRDCEQGLDSEFLQDVDWWPNNLTNYDLSFDSPYNTRKNAGLPPSPISSFGVSALKSVISHVDTDYYFYLTDDQGVTHFSQTLQQHNANTVKYL